MSQRFLRTDGTHAAAPVESRKRVRSTLFFYVRHFASLSQTLFWPVWFILTGAAALFTARFCRQSAHRPVRERKTSNRAPWHSSRRIILALTTLVVFLVAYGAVVLAWEDFAWYDDSFFTTVALRGLNFSIPVWPESGRFFPLGLQEFNVIRHLTQTAWGYHLFAILELLILAVLLLLLEDEFSVPARVVLAVLAVSTPSAVVSITNLADTERSLLLLLIGLALAVKRFEQTRSPRWAVAAVVSAQIMLYLKEPIFLLLLAFSTTRIILRARNSHGRGWNFERVLDVESRLDVCIAAVSVMFFGYYAIAVLPFSKALYLAYNGVSLSDTFRFYLRWDPLAWVFAIFVTVRAHRVLSGEAVPELLWDGLACGAAVYFVAYLKMQLTTYYYLAPVDLIAVLYLGRHVLLAWGGMRIGFRVATATVLAALTYQNLDLSGFLTVKRKYLIQQKAAVARQIATRYKQNPGMVRGLYFPFTTPYVLSEFAAYLSYYGVPAEEAGRQTSAGGPTKLFGGKIANEGKCMVYSNFICHPGAAPESGNMIVVLPDDPVLPGESEFYKKSGDEFWAHDRAPHVPKLLILFLSFPWREI
jgi:hypothetical protein